MRLPDLVLAIVGFAVAGAVWAVARTYPDVPWPLGGPPAFFPVMLAAALALLLAVMLVESWAGGGAGEPTSARGVSRVALAVAGLALVPLAMRLLGFHATGVLVVLGAMLLIHGLRGLTLPALALMLAVAVAASFGLHFVFQDLAGRRLPAGLLFR